MTTKPATYKPISGYDWPDLVPGDLPLVNAITTYTRCLMLPMIKTDKR